MNNILQLKLRNLYQIYFKDYFIKESLMLIFFFFVFLPKNTFLEMCAYIGRNFHYMSVFLSPFIFLSLYRSNKLINNHKLEDLDVYFNVNFKSKIIFRFFAMLTSNLPLFICLFFVYILSFSFLYLLNFIICLIVFSLVGVFFLSGKKDREISYISIPNIYYLIAHKVIKENNLSLFLYYFFSIVLIIFCSKMDMQNKSQWFISFSKSIWFFSYFLLVSTFTDIKKILHDKFTFLINIKKKILFYFFIINLICVPVILFNFTCVNDFNSYLYLNFCIFILSSYFVNQKYEAQVSIFIVFYAINIYLGSL